MLDPFFRSNVWAFLMEISRDFRIQDRKSAAVPNCDEAEGKHLPGQPKGSRILREKVFLEDIRTQTIPPNLKVVLMTISTSSIERQVTSPSLAGAASAIAAAAAISIFWWIRPNENKRQVVSSSLLKQIPVRSRDKSVISPEQVGPVESPGFSYHLPSKTKRRSDRLKQASHEEDIVGWHR